MDPSSIFLEEDKWMSKFYGEKWFKVISNDFKLPENQSGIVEWRIESKKPRVLQNAIEMGFEMVETFVEFETEVIPPNCALPNTLRLAEYDDLKDILNLVQICLIENNNFYSRFKNLKYFTPEHCKEYYFKSIENYFLKDDNITIVSESNGITDGFFLMRLLKNGKFKGALAGVLPNSRGKGMHIYMQNKISEIIGRKYTVVNTTQISNYFVINNHIQEQKRLSKIEHILYKKLNH